MTLHWWMHWFWITFQFTCCIILTHSKPMFSTTTITTIPSETDTTILQSNRPLYRPVKSIGSTAPKLHQQSQISITVPLPDISDTADTSTNIGEPMSQLYKTKLLTNQTSPAVCNTSVTNSTSNNTQLLLCNETQSMDNQTTEINLSTEHDVTTDNINLTSSSEDGDNSTLTSVIVTKELVSNRAHLDDSDNISENNTLTAVSITGISFGVLVFATIMGVTSFILYRRRYLNKPQTLNDKCSNPDSSGYIDDSTMRENSEEMYSLDNDSFLNSLEAMTIQNYWTDSVKHTKL